MQVSLSAPKGKPPCQRSHAIEYDDAGVSPAPLIRRRRHGFDALVGQRGGAARWRAESEEVRPLMERADPLSEYRNIQEWMERQQRQGLLGRVPSIGRWTPQLDVLEGENDYRIQLALPGVRPADVQITVEQSVVTVSGELHQSAPDSGTRYLHQEQVGGHFTRSIALPGMVDADQTSAHYEHGIMTITLPKHAATRPRRITVQTGGDKPPVEGQSVGSEPAAPPPV